MTELVRYKNKLIEYLKKTINEENAIEKALTNNHI